MGSICGKVKNDGQYDPPDDLTGSGDKDPIRLWNGQFEEWKMEGCPFDDPAVPVPGPAPDPNHGWNHGVDGKK